MTTILWVNNRLYADTMVQKDGEFFHSLDKIRKLPKPIALKSTKNNVDDMIHGYTWSGSAESAKGFIDKIGTWEDQDSMLTAYEMALGLNLYNDINFFEIILIGEKDNYSFLFGSDQTRLKVYPHKTLWSMGAGGKTVFDLVDEGAHPLRAMYHTFGQSKYSGGMIDVWEITNSDKGEFNFNRVGLCNELTPEKIRQVSADLKKPYSLDIREKVWQISRTLSGLGIFDFEDIEAVKQFTKRRAARSKPKAVSEPEKPAVPARTSAKPKPKGAKRS